MIRLILIFIFLILFFFVGLFTNLYIMAVRKKDENKAYDISNSIVGNAFSGVLFLAGTKRIVKGKENIPESSALYVGNHRSYFDIVVTHSSLKKAGKSGKYRVPLGFIAKIEIDKVPFLRTWMRNIGCLFLDRKDTKAALKSILEGIEILKKDTEAWLFTLREHEDIQMK
ncbi:MAG: 1-acyl-sn-glycerol-3-phosphate acyltransferase [Lachnospiraceae bacterium]|nr:1-acyl-sn-glycerol-3-phosphate acyltransferase [Lachnospiraceae bacterium]